MPWNIFDFFQPHLGNFGNFLPIRYFSSGSMHHDISWIYDFWNIRTISSKKKKRSLRVNIRINSFGWRSRISGIFWICNGSMSRELFYNYTLPTYIFLSLSLLLYVCVYKVIPNEKLFSLFYVPLNPRARGLI